MAEAFLEKATSTLTEAKESVSTTAENAKASLTDAEKTVASSAETVKTEAAAAPKKASDVSTKAREVVDNAVSRGFEGAKNLFHTLEEKRTEVSSKLVGAVTNVVSGASSSTVASRDLPASTDNQPLLTSGDRGVETTPWWKNCCGVLDLLKTSTTR